MSGNEEKNEKLYLAIKPELLSDEHEDYSAYLHLQGHVFRVLKELSPMEWLGECITGLSMGGEPFRMSLNKEDVLAVEPPPAI